MTKSPFVIGDRVKLKSTGEVGVVAWVWYDETIGYDHYVVFFGREYPQLVPTEPPSLLRYSAASLERIDAITEAARGKDPGLSVLETSDAYRIDGLALLEHRGLACIDTHRARACEHWLQREGYTLARLDCSLEFPQLLRELGRLLRWQEQFGSPMEDSQGNLHDLADGFEFEVQNGGAVLVLEHPEALAAKRPAWFDAFLEISARHSLLHLSQGRRFFVLLVVERESSLPGHVYASSRIPSIYSHPNARRHGFVEP